MTTLMDHNVLLRKYPQQTIYETTMSLAQENCTVPLDWLAEINRANGNVFNQTDVPCNSIWPTISPLTANNISTATAANQSLVSSNYEEMKFYIKNPHDMLHPSEINSSFLPIIITHTLTFLIGVIGNCVVIATWSMHGKFRSPTAVFLVSLAIADLLLLLVFVPLETLEYFMITWGGLSSICKMIAYVEVISAMSTVLNLVAVSIERFLVIVYPMRARSWCTMSSTRKGLIIIWGLAFVLSTPVLFTKHTSQITYYNDTTSLTLYYCFDVENELTFIVAVYQLLVMFVLPAFFMVACYYVVIRQLWVSTRSVNVMTQSDNGPHQSIRSFDAEYSPYPAESHSIAEEGKEKQSCFSQFLTHLRPQQSTFELQQTGNGSESSRTSGAVTPKIHWRLSDSSATSKWYRTLYYNCCHCSHSAIHSRKHGIADESETTMSTFGTAYADNGGPDGRGRDSLDGSKSPDVAGERNGNITHTSTEAEEIFVISRSPTEVGTSRSHEECLKFRGPSRTLPTNVMEITRSRFQVIKMLVLIVSLFLLCWGPRLIMNVLVKLGLQTYSTWIYNTRIVCNLLSFVHSALNPFVYGFMSSNFRAMVCSSLRRRKKSSSVRQWPSGGTIRRRG